MRIPIAKSHFLPGKADRLALARETIHLIDDLFKFGTVSPGVHKEGTAHGAWNTFGEFQSAVSFPGRFSYQLRDGVSRAEPDSGDFAFRAPFNLFELSRQMNHRAAHPAIADQDVAAVAQ